MSMSGGMFMSPRNSIKLMALGVGLVVLTTAGCATKKFVRQSVQESIQPLQASLNKVDQKTDQNAEQIRDVDRKAERGLAQANEAQEMVNNIDNYKPAQQATVLFGFNKSILTTEDKQRLDQLVQNV